MNVTDVRSFLGLASYCSLYIKDFATISTPLIELTKQGRPFEWTAECEEAFVRIRQAVTSVEHLAYFDALLCTELTVDASPVGLGAILAQHKPGRESPRQIVTYASRSLMGVEKAYSQPEKESLAVVWACEHHHMFLYVKSFTIVTDHQALTFIYANPRAKIPLRIER